jgi:hypothetical protein
VVCIGFDVFIMRVIDDRVGVGEYIFKDFGGVRSPVAD